jgi:outer membrane protein OmpA-like peptidoglycan-associated protein
MKKSIIGLLFPSVLFFFTTALAQKMEPTEKDALLTVSVINEKEKPQAGEQVYFESISSKKVYSGITKEGGKFDILVPKGDRYNVKYKTIASDAEYTVLEVPNNKGELLSFEVTIQYELPKTYTLDNVYFETGKADIKPSSFKYIDEMAEYMKLKKSLVIEISGHTDNVGTPESNLKLSQDRANSVRAYLIKKGIADNRVTAKGYGDTQPVASNDTDAGKQKNRRTEVKVIKE